MKNAVWSGDVVSRLIGFSAEHISTLFEYNGNFVSGDQITKSLRSPTTRAPCNPRRTSIREGSNNGCREQEDQDEDEEAHEV